MRSKDALLQIKDLRISFPNENRMIQVVRGIDLEIIEGEIIGILDRKSVV